MVVNWLVCSCLDDGVGGVKLIRFLFCFSCNEQRVWLRFVFLSRIFLLYDQRRQSSTITIFMALYSCDNAVKMRNSYQRGRNLCLVLNNADSCRLIKPTNSPTANMLLRLRPEQVRIVSAHTYTRLNTEGARIS